MKKLTLPILLSLISLSGFAQWTTNGNSVVTDKNVTINQNSNLGVYLGDSFKHNNLAMGHYALGWMADSWTTSGVTLWQSGFGGIKFFTGGGYRMGITLAGNVGIGTDKPKSKLDVKGDIRATEIKIEDISKWSDFVFDKDYKLRSLSEVEDHINTYKHLPEIPSEAQVKEEGINVVEMQAKLLQKIEELTLYVIKQDKEIQELRKDRGNH